MTPVAIALVRREGCYLIRLRPEMPGSPMPGVWEFPGGKCEPGESPERAAACECFEETGIAIEVGPRRRTVAHRYPHGEVTLHYYDATPLDPHTRPTEGSGFRWVAARDLSSLTFPEANGPILEALAFEGTEGPAA